MSVRNQLILPAIFLLAVAFCETVRTNGGPPADTEKPGSSPRQPLSVSMLQLIANPEAFDGKYVRVWGFVRIEFEGTAVYLHREDFEQSLMVNGLWLAVNDGVVGGSKEEKINNRYGLIEGQFNARNRGHLGLWSGTIEKITRMEPWAIREEKK